MLSFRYFRRNDAIRGLVLVFHHKLVCICDGCYLSGNYFRPDFRFRRTHGGTLSTHGSFEHIIEYFLYLIKSTEYVIAGDRIHAFWSPKLRRHSTASSDGESAGNVYRFRSTNDMSGERVIELRSEILRFRKVDRTDAHRELVICGGEDERFVIIAEMDLRLRWSPPLIRAFLVDDDLLKFGFEFVNRHIESCGFEGILYADSGRVTYDLIWRYGYSL
ncbi:hypothetical protein NY2A_b193L [Paramecium bursaria Chlorella virus NY2A]|uniref:Uncharacterized protein b193L n=1 Tax=Paramecium bursaria Chlorella virus NY2A TaxID=46021 RepID=A7IW68_PBCVN|nr:hypothetical protein NY2A_b193L [Paramecium bursaria Chlorella virus NY2A]ABT14592.1 hypothetical protein NY2A_b193L [Paramecium bursaria Chlorella virus NY2A]